MTTEKRPYDQKTCDRIVLERILSVQQDLQSVPAHLLRHGADSAVTDLLHLAAHHLDLACRRIQFDTYMDKKNKGKL